MLERDFLYDVTVCGTIDLSVETICNRYTPTEIKAIIASPEFKNWYEGTRRIVISSIQGA